MPALKAVIGGDSTGFSHEMEKVQHMAMHTAHTVGAIFGGIGAMEIVRGAVEAGERIRGLSQEFRQSYDTVQKWDIAAKRTNQTAEDIGNAFNRLKKAREAAIGTGNLGGFAAFNIPMEALRDATITTDQILERMVQVVGGERITDEQDVAGMELMGRGGAKILSAFQELHELGPVKLIGDDEVDKMHELKEGFENFERWSKAQAGKGFIAATAAPKSLGEMFRNLWNYAFGKKEHSGGMVFDIGGAYGMGGAGGEGGGLPGKLSGKVTHGMTVSQITEMKKLQQEISEQTLKNDMKTMSTEEKRAELNRQITEHMKASDKAFEDAEWVQGYKELLEATKLRGELQALPDDPMAADKFKSSLLRGHVNSLQQIGAYTSPASSALIDVSRSQLNVLRSIDSKMGNGGRRNFGRVAY